MYVICPSASPHCFFFSLLWLVTACIDVPRGVPTLFLPIAPPPPSCSGALYGSRRARQGIRAAGTADAAGHAGPLRGRDHRWRRRRPRHPRRAPQPPPPRPPRRPAATRRGRRRWPCRPLSSPAAATTPASSQRCRVNWGGVHGRLRRPPPRLQFVLLWWWRRPRAARLLPGRGLGDAPRLLLQPRASQGVAACCCCGE